MKMIFIVIGLFLSTSSFASNIVVESDVVSDTTWAVDSVFVQGSVTIAGGVTLSIQPGTKVLFSDHYRLMVLGAIKALGAEGDSIVFSALDTTGFWDDYIQNTGSWSGIEYPEGSVQTDTSYFQYCVFQFAKATELNDISSGAVIHAQDVSGIKILNCSFRNNSAQGSGGAIYAKNANLQLSKTRFVKNYAYGGNGGAIYFFSYPQFELDACYFKDNKAFKGGGIYLLDVIQLTVNNCNFYRNFAKAMSPVITDNYGGAISVYRGFISDPMTATITHNKIISSQATTGAAVYFEENVEALIENNTFAENRAGNTAAAIGQGKDCNFTIKNNLFTNNEANSGGALYYNYNGKGLKLINNLFANNYGRDDYASYTGYGGGAVSIVNTVSPVEIINNTFVNNRHNYMGGALHLVSKNARIINNIFYNNSAPNAPQIAINTKGANNDSLMYPDLKYNCIQSGHDSIGVYRSYALVEYDSSYHGVYENNININPKFIQISPGVGINYNGLEADWSLQGNSPCINSGNPFFTSDSIGVETDLAGNPRIYMFGQNQIADIGGYEFQGLPTGFEENKQLPLNSTLYQNYPNPFNPITKIRYQLAKQAAVQLAVYNILGQKVQTLVNRNQQPGTYSIHFDGSALASGIYYCRLRTGTATQMRKMVLLK